MSDDHLVHVSYRRQHIVSPLKGNMKSSIPRIQKKLARMKPQNRFNASAPGQPVRTIAFEIFLVFNNEAKFGMILNKHLKGNGF
ncbi:MAG TPA: hypothetical protein DEF62_00075 [Porphyromonas gingivalis]|nr:hypothetical protein [Porphyromonas gingivalis]